MGQECLFFYKYFCQTNKADMNNYYTYAYLREDGTPYYIGKGKDKRAYQTHSVEVPPKSRILLLKQNLTEEQAFNHERYMIAVFGRISSGSGILLNKTAGGQGLSGFTGKKSQEHKDNIKKSLLKSKRRKHQELYLVENNLGVSIKEINTFRGICRKYGIDVGYGCKILKGERKTYKGWSIKKLSHDT